MHLQEGSGQAQHRQDPDPKEIQYRQFLHARDFFWKLQIPKLNCKGLIKIAFDSNKFLQIGNSIVNSIIDYNRILLENFKR